MSKNLVLSGNHSEYKQFLVDNNLYEQDFIYIDSVCVANEFRGHDIIFVGSYYMRYDYYTIMDALDISWCDCVNDY